MLCKQVTSPDVSGRRRGNDPGARGLTCLDMASRFQPYEMRDQVKQLHKVELEPIIHGLRPIRKKGRQIITNIGCTYLTRRIGSTTYRVRVHFSAAAKETMQDKIVRLIRNEALDSGPECGIMELPQTSRQPGRSTP